MQHTLKNDMTFVGIGLHSGRPVRLAVRPAVVDSGIQFVRTDISDQPNFVAAHWRNVFDTKLSTNIRNDSGVTVSTIEHIMAALVGCGITNATIEVDGPEVPIMDGSSRQFVGKILRTGIVAQAAMGFVWVVRRTVTVQDGLALAEFTPVDRIEIDYSITFENTIVGTQSARLDMRGDTFANELADCRTFCRNADVDAMKGAGLALGGSMDNALVIDGDHYLNPEGPRRVDECVRHKMLDAVGDLALAGAPILGRYRGVRAGHRMTNLLLRKLFETDGAVAKIPATQTILSVLPGTTAQETDLLRAG
ncbi:MAG: UDP-3-O-[3-hydroxymyristoyl] N-acetylglucosamine deacetylase [Rhodobacteraceae bacterium]|nr:UDP-3-O-[3-hydroxymyristoyl] N-acetylglucosamine deacetylase [Paracoccaceae bacterium]